MKNDPNFFFEGIAFSNVDSKPCLKLCGHDVFRASQNSSNTNLKMIHNRRLHPTKSSSGRVLEASWDVLGAPGGVLWAS